MILVATHGLGISDMQASTELGLAAAPTPSEERASPLGLRPLSTLWSLGFILLSVSLPASCVQMGFLLPTPACQSQTQEPWQFWCPLGLTQSVCPNFTVMVGGGGLGGPVQGSVHPWPVPLRPGTGRVAQATSFRMERQQATGQVYFSFPS